MDKDRFNDYIECNHPDLVERFFKEKQAISDMFDDFCFDEFNNSEADRADYLYEQERDRQLEEGTLKED